MSNNLATGASKRNRNTAGITHPQTANRVLIQKYGERGLGGVKGAASGVVTLEGGEQYYTDTTEALRLIEAGLAFYVKDQQGRVVEEQSVVAPSAKDEK